MSDHLLNLLSEIRNGSEGLELVATELELGGLSLGRHFSVDKQEEAISRVGLFLELLWTRVLPSQAQRTREGLQGPGGARVSSEKIHVL